MGLPLTRKMQGAGRMWGLLFVIRGSFAIQAEIERTILGWISQSDYRLNSSRHTQASVQLPHRGALLELLKQPHTHDKRVVLELPSKLTQGDSRRQVANDNLELSVWQLEDCDRSIQFFIMAFIHLAETFADLVEFDPKLLVLCPQLGSVDMHLLSE